MAYCEKHKIEYVDIYKIGGIAYGRRCPECMADEDAAIERREKERQEYDRIQKIKDMNIEPMFLEASLDNFTAGTPELEKAVDSVRKLIAGEIQQIVMTGKNGTGKTHLAVAAVKELGGRILSMYEITARIRASYTSMARETELHIVDELSHLPLLAIDELGRTKGSDAETNWLSYIIDKRHSRSLPTIIISNKHVKKDCPAHGCDQCLENYISEDIMSRLSEGGILLRFTGDDWRKKPRATT